MYVQGRCWPLLFLFGIKGLKQCDQISVTFHGAQNAQIDNENALKIITVGNNDVTKPT